MQDRWAVFAVETSTYAWLSEEAKRSRLLSLMGALEALKADVQILRVGRRWPVERYAREMKRVAGSDPTLSGRIRDGYVEEHRRRLEDLDAAAPVLFLVASLREPEQDIASYVS